MNKSGTLDNQDNAMLGGPYSQLNSSYQGLKPIVDNQSPPEKKQRRGRANRSGGGSSDPSQER